MPAVLPTTSREFIRVAVTATGIDSAALTTLTVKFAFLTSRTTQPVTNDFVAGSWEPGLPSPALARCLVGPGGTVALQPNTYFVWIFIQGAVEQPIRQVGSLQIT